MKTITIYLQSGLTFSTKASEAEVERILVRISDERKWAAIQGENGQISNIRIESIQAIDVK